MRSGVYISGLWGRSWPPFASVTSSTSCNAAVAGAFLEHAKEGDTHGNELEGAWASDDFSD